MPSDDAGKARREELREGVNVYAKYSGMAFQMAGIILLFTLAGRWADGYLAFESPYLAVGGALVGTFTALYVALKDIIFPKP